ncbi:MAG: IMPACT family protein [Xanthomonadales bacterium]|nr:IMPACT family protein [Xanthomonadales bacterium]
MPTPTNKPLLKLLQNARYEVEIKHSRFLVHAGCVENLADTLEFFEQVKDSAATHNCWAYRLGQSYRFADDGEPASTAGKPILAAIDGQGFDRAMVVVTRYYGGTKLGVGGLIRAYGGSTSRCLQQAQSETIIASSRGIIRAPFSYTGAIHQALAELGAVRLKEKHDAEGLVISIEIATAEWSKLAEHLKNNSRGTASLRPLA